MRGALGNTENVRKTHISHHGQQSAKSGTESLGLWSRHDVAMLVVSALLDAIAITGTHAAAGACCLNRQAGLLISSQEDNQRREATDPASRAREHVQLHALSTDDTDL